MIIEEGNIRITATFSEDRTHRYSLRREWWDDDSKPTATATIIMSHASGADIVKGDLTTSVLIQNNLAALGYRAVICCNLFSRITSDGKLDLSGDISDFTNEDNTHVTLQAIRETDICIIAIGSLSTTHKKVAVHQYRLFDMLRAEGFQDKIYTISAPDGSEQLHPSSGKLRAAGSWKLIPYALPSPPPTNKELVDAPADMNNMTKLSRAKKSNK